MPWVLDSLAASLGQTIALAIGCYLLYGSLALVLRGGPARLLGAIVAGLLGVLFTVGPFVEDWWRGLVGTLSGGFAAFHGVTVWRGVAKGPIDHAAVVDFSVRKRRGLLGLLVITIIGGGFLAAGQVLRTSRDQSASGHAAGVGWEALVEESSALNAQLPVRVDAETELFSTSVVEPGVLNYNYRLVRYARGEINFDRIRTQVRRTALNAACSTPELRTAYLDRGIALRHTYYDKEKTWLGGFQLSGADCPRPQ